MYAPSPTSIAQDAPEYTQPMLYKQIAKHPRTHAVFEQTFGRSWDSWDLHCMFPPISGCLRC
jgi:hypothetical protein